MAKRDRVWGPLYGKRIPTSAADRSTEPASEISRLGYLVRFGPEAADLPSLSLHASIIYWLETVVLYLFLNNNLFYIFV